MPLRLRHVEQLRGAAVVVEASCCTAIGAAARGHAGAADPPPVGDCGGGLEGDIGACLAAQSAEWAASPPPAAPAPARLRRGNLSETRRKLLVGVDRLDNERLVLLVGLRFSAKLGCCGAAPPETARDRRCRSAAQTSCRSPRSALARCQWAAAVAATRHRRAAAVTSALRHSAASRCRRRSCSRR
jgi:hypothetical protein